MYMLLYQEDSELLHKITWADNNYTGSSVHDLDCPITLFHPNDRGFSAQEYEVDCGVFTVW